MYLVSANLLTFTFNTLFYVVTTLADFDFTGVGELFQLVLMEYSVWCHYQKQNTNLGAQL